MLYGKVNPTATVDTRELADKVGPPRKPLAISASKADVVENKGTNIPLCSLMTLERFECELDLHADLKR